MLRRFSSPYFRGKPKGIEFWGSRLGQLLFEADRNCGCWDAQNERSSFLSCLKDGEGHQQEFSREVSSPEFCMSSATAIASDCGPRKKQLVAKQEFLSLLLLPQLCPPFSSSSERDRKRPLSCGKPEATEAASSVVVLC